MQYRSPGRNILAKMIGVVLKLQADSMSSETVVCGLNIPLPGKLSKD